jgi:hypothetical protein
MLSGVRTGSMMLWRHAPAFCLCLLISLMDLRRRMAQTEFAHVYRLERRGERLSAGLL